MQSLRLRDVRLPAAVATGLVLPLALSIPLRAGAVMIAVACAAIAGVAVCLVLLDRAGRALREARQQYRLLADNMSDVVTRHDLDFRITYASPSSKSLSGYDAAELLGTGTFATVHPDDRDMLERQFQRLADGRVDRELATFRLAHKDGGQIWVESALTLVRGSGGAPEAIAAATRDVSSRKVQSDELRTVNLELERLARHLSKARDRSELASSAKTRFLAGMSHELRTPLNGVIGYAHLLRIEGGLTEKQQGRVAGMLQAGDHLLQMIDHVLNLSEIEADRVELQVAEFDVAATARACLALVAPSAEAKQLAHRLVVDPAAPRAVVADCARLRQVLLNLLGNAVKFTTTGSIELRIVPGASKALRLEVVDTGPGVPTDQIHRLFSEFDRLDAANSSVEGAGLGLAISSRLVTLMGGEIGYAANPDGGGIFWVEMPAGSLCGAEAPAPAPLHRPTRRLRVLVADDVAMNRDIAQAFLRAVGHDAVSVDSGQAAIERVADGGFDVVLLDVLMPGIDGLEAARRIRAMRPPLGLVPIVALTAQAFSEQVEECRAAGMNGHVSKPFTPEALRTAVEQAVAMKPGSAIDASLEALSLPLFDRKAFAQTAVYLDAVAIEPYLAMIAARAETLLSSLQASDAADLALAGLAHEFAGSASMFGFLRAAELARRFERAIETVSPNAAHLGRHLTEALTATVPLIQAEMARALVED